MSSTALASEIATLGGASSSVIVTSDKLSEMLAFTGLDRATSKVSSTSSKLSLTSAIDSVSWVLPGLKVMFVDVAV